MKRLLREPLVHFLLAGAALVAVSAFIPDSRAPRDERIVVSEGQIEHLVARFTRTWKRPPSVGELDGLIAAFVEEEVAYREGMALGLLDDDTIIRRRVRQKLEFITTDIAALTQPTDEDLAAYLATHSDDFTEEARFTFVHVFLDPARRGGDVDADAAEILELLTLEPDRDLRDLGDRILIAPLQKDRAAWEVTETFGTEFTAALADGPAAGVWFGPVPSTSGLHLVRVLKRIRARLPALDEIRGDVIREWDNARRAEAKEQFYDTLLDRYEVIVEWPQAAPADSLQ